VKASAWKWMAIAFIVLSVIMASFAWTYYSKYNYERSAAQWSAGGWNEALSLLNLENETTLVNDQTVSEPPGSAYEFSFTIQYAGYIEVIVSSSTSPSTYVQVIGKYYPLWVASNTGWTYGSGQMQVGYGGTVYFPVVPGSVAVYIWNNNANSGATETVTIIYYS